MQTESLEAIAGKLTTKGSLRNARVLEKPRGQFISAELLPEGEEEGHDGHILTWFTADPASGQFFAVDARAREHSSWPAAEFDVRADGAITSRGCVLPLRGKAEGGNCQAGFEQFC